MYESLRQLVLDSEHKDASVLFAALDMNFFVQLGAEEVKTFNFTGALQMEPFHEVDL